MQDLGYSHQRLTMACAVCRGWRSVHSAHQHADKVPELPSPLLRLPLQLWRRRSRSPRSRQDHPPLRPVRPSNVSCPPAPLPSPILAIMNLGPDVRALSFSAKLPLRIICTLCSSDGFIPCWHPIPGCAQKPDSLLPTKLYLPCGSSSFHARTSVFDLKALWLPAGLRTRRLCRL